MTMLNTTYLQLFVCVYDVQDIVLFYVMLISCIEMFFFSVRQNQVSCFPLAIFDNLSFVLFGGSFIFNVQIQDWY